MIAAPGSLTPRVAVGALALLIFAVPVAAQNGSSFLDASRSAIDYTIAST